MTKARSSVLVLVGVAAMVVGVVLAFFFAAPPNHGARDAAAALAMIGAASVGIERVIEMLWTALGSFLGEWWPLTIVRQQVDALEKDLDPTVAKFYVAASAALDLAGKAGKLTVEELQKAQAELDRQNKALEAQLKELRRLAPDSQRVQLLSVAAKQKVDLVEAKYAAFSDDVQRAVNEAKQSITAAGDFIATFKENPGKKFISIWVGMLLGLGAAAFLGLDVFVAVLGPEGAVAATPDPIGVVATGLVIGLGAGPTHEVVRVLQEVKKARRTENQAAAA